MTKDELRCKMRAVRRALTADEIKSASEKICNLLFSLDCVRSAEEVCVFLSAFKEPNTDGIIQRLLDKNVKVAAPITDAETGVLSLAYITDFGALETGAYGIREPRAENAASAENADIILVPGLAFDRRGARLGFGRGCYDRLLTKSSAVKIGICYDFQLLESIPSECHDVPMDFVVTEKEIVEIS